MPPWLLTMALTHSMRSTVPELSPSMAWTNSRTNSCVGFTRMWTHSRISISLLSRSPSPLRSQASKMFQGRSTEWKRSEPILPLSSVMSLTNVSTSQSLDFRSSLRNSSLPMSSFGVMKSCPCASIWKTWLCLKLTCCTIALMSGKPCASWKRLRNALGEGSSWHQSQNSFRVILPSWLVLYLSNSDLQWKYTSSSAMWKSTVQTFCTPRTQDSSMIIASSKFMLPTSPSWPWNSKVSKTVSIFLPRSPEDSKM
mmetsp:Transcript_16650/g.46094  ORF Transcript_16650/g.46094 Transcript_16650/m.46094 type:complete len:254 (+) Transcript_16650:195-956(+)